MEIIIIYMEKQCQKNLPVDGFEWIEDYLK